MIDRKDLHMKTSNLLLAISKEYAENTSEDLKFVPIHLKNKLNPPFTNNQGSNYST